MINRVVDFADELVVSRPFAIVARADAAVGEAGFLEVFDQPFVGGRPVLFLVAEDLGLGFQEPLAQQRVLFCSARKYALWWHGRRTGRIDRSR